MNKKIFFLFSDSYKSFQELAVISFDMAANSFYLTLPINVYYGNLLEKQKLFEVDFKVKINNKNHMKKLCKSFSYNMVNDYFNYNFSKTTVLDELRLRAEKWISDELIEPVYINILGLENEFIEIDNETSFHGDYSLNCKKGCILKYGANCKVEQISSFAVEPYISIYDLPYDMQNYLHQNMSNEERFNVLLSLGLEKTIELLKTKLNENYTLTIEELYCPYKIFLKGTDDDSWTRYFYTKEEMMKEVYRLRRCQPINLYIDIENNFYHYTN